MWNLCKGFKVYKLNYKRNLWWGGVVVVGGCTISSRRGKNMFSEREGDIRAMVRSVRFDSFLSGQTIWWGSSSSTGWGGIGRLSNPLPLKHPLLSTTPQHCQRHYISVAVFTTTAPASLSLLVLSPTLTLPQTLD